MQQYMANSKGKEYTLVYSGVRAGLSQLFNFCYVVYILINLLCYKRHVKKEGKKKQKKPEDGAFVVFGSSRKAT